MDKEWTCSGTPGRVGGRRPKLTPQQQKEIVSLVTSGQKTGADAARLFRIHPFTVARLLGVSLDIENYCTLRLFFDLVDLN